MDLRKSLTLASILALNLTSGPITAQDAVTAGAFGPDAVPARVATGNVRLTGILAPGGAPYPGTVFTVLRAEPGAFGKARYRIIATAGPQTQAVFRLNPGRYRIEARNGAVTTDHLIEVPDTNPLRRDIVLDAGELRLRGVMSADGPDATETWFRVLREDRDSYGRPVRVPVAGSGYAQSAGFVVPAGDYIAEARYGDTRAEVPVRVSAGKVTEEVLVLDAGLLALHATLDSDGAPATGARFRVYRRAHPGTGRDTGPAAWVPVTEDGGGDSIAFVLPAGDYRVRVELDRAAAETRVTLPAGETRDLELPLNAGRLTLQTSLDESEQSRPLLDAWFGVTPAGGWTGDSTVNASTPRGPGDRADFVLPAGRYLASARVGQSEHSVTLDIAPGSEQAIDIVQDAGRVRLALVAGPPGSPLDHVWFSVYRIEQDAQGHITRRRVFNDGYHRTTEEVLPAGRYVASARHPTLRGEVEFELKPGETRRLAIVGRDRVSNRPGD